MDTPVLFLIFNRIDTTQTVFEKIRQQKPKYLFVAADGPRKNKAGEAELCQQVRSIVIDNIDWDCELRTLFREENLGCKIAVSDAITWFFSNVEKGIILEDDCLPNTSFFRYCTELLDKYESNSQIMTIGGINHVNDNKQFSQNGDSYYFSKYFHCWGWASWRRAWASYDRDMKQWNSFYNLAGLKKLRHGNFLFRLHWKRRFNDVLKGKFNTWDYQMLFNIWNNDGLCITPAQNLVSNIGFGAGATHTSNNKSSLSERNTEEMKFPMQHPQIIQNIESDKKENKIEFKITLLKEITREIRHTLSI